jgi:hypothetical protein
MVFLPKDDKMKNLMERLYRDHAAETSYEMAKQLSRYKQIREMRRQEHLYIGMDRKMGKSVIYAKKPIQRKGKGFIL